MPILAVLFSSIEVNKAVFPSYFKVIVDCGDSIFMGTNLAVGVWWGGVIGGLVDGGVGPGGGFTGVGPGGAGGGSDLLQPAAMMKIIKMKKFLSLVFIAICFLAFRKLS